MRTRIVFQDRPRRRKVSLGGLGENLFQFSIILRPVRSAAFSSTAGAR